MLRIATRKSPLALAQAHLVAEALKGVPSVLHELMTTGDRFLAEKLSEIGGKGLFTKELDQALLAGEAEIAVHSLKDVPTELPEGLVLAAVLPRADASDVLIGAPNLGALSGKKVGTVSLRRAALVLAHAPDATIHTLRGNVHTRLDKLARGEVDATILAKAGLDRLGLSLPEALVLDAELFVPAVAQGAIGIICRKDDEKTLALLRTIHCSGTFDCVLAERAMLRTLDGSCRTPIAGHATLQGDTLRLTGLIALPDGSAHHRLTQTAPRAEAEALGVAVGQALIKEAGLAFLARCKG